jgi:outer membrane protein assembly factor BamB/tRNA A-37 threonylcarbamoyl transferase component Bud32
VNWQVAIIAHSLYNSSNPGIEDGILSKLDTRKIETDSKLISLQQEGTLPAHTVLEERYEILAVQGVGGMGAVYRARDLRFSAVTKIVAVKEMSNVAPDPRLRRIGIQNFEREANILASLSHPAIPKIFDYFSEGSRSYLVLEFIEGQNLETLLEERRRPFSQEEAVEWALQVCDVLVYLHSHTPPVVFRDVKPGNLMLRYDGRIMVIDFGIAKVFEHGQRGTMIGTEGYSPPEQYRGVAEPRGDLYALGATLHHLLTARDPRLEPPFTFHERPVKLFNPEVSAEIEAVVLKSLAYDVQERFASASEMAMALNNALPLMRRGTAGLGTTGLGTSAFASHQEITPKWTFKCEDEVRSSPRIAEGVLYIGCYDNNLYALNVADGSFLWKFPTEGGIASTPCIYEDVILIGSEDSKLYAVSRRIEHVVWFCETQGRIRSSARVEYGHAFFGSDDGCLYVVNAQSGRLVWKFQSAGPIRSTPFVSDEKVFFGSDDGYVYALDMRAGGVKWKYNTNRRVTSSPCIADNLLLIGSADGHLYGINARSGWPVWRFRTGGYVLSSPTVVGDMVYVGSADGHLYAIELNTGRQRWKYDAKGPVTSSPAVADDVIYVGSNDGVVHAVDARKGQGLWRYVTQGPVPSSPLVLDGIVYVGSTDHIVYALPA